VAEKKTPLCPSLMLAKRTKAFLLSGQSLKRDIQLSCLDESPCRSTQELDADSFLVLTIADDHSAWFLNGVYRGQLPQYDKQHV
jgi:hypothetical protein